MPRQRPGVTLVDLVVTVLVIGLTASVAIPKLADSLDDYQVESAARQVAAIVNYTGQQARVTSTQVTLTFDAVAETVTVSGIDHPDHVGQQWTLDLSRIADTVDLVSADFSGDADVTIEVDGRPDSSGTVVISAGSLQRTVTVSASTGKATVS